MLHSLLWNLVETLFIVYVSLKMGESMTWYQNCCDRDRLEKASGCPAASYTQMSSASNKVINSTSCPRFLSEELFHLDAAVMTKSAVQS